MTKQELFEKIINTTADVCGVSATAIIAQDNHAEVVDARCIAIDRCRYYGLTTRDIMTMMQRPNTSTIRCLAATYQDRSASFGFRVFSTEIRRRLADSLAEYLTEI